MAYIGVIGSGSCGAEIGLLAYQVGEEIARRGAVLVCGGKGGGMEYVCRGNADAGGVSLGILPGLQRSEANPHVTYALTTGLGELRNFLVVRCSDALISVAGEYGTLSEMAIALKEGKRVVALPPPYPLAGLVMAATAGEAVDKALF